jgi:hypothetical protein
MYLRSTVLMSVGLLATTANAAIINRSFTGIASPAYTITFSEVTLTPGVTQVTNQFASYGANFSPAATYSSQAGLQNIVGYSLSNLPSGFSSPFTISFSTLQSSAAFAMVSNIKNYEFESFLGNKRVERFFTIVGPTRNNFYGFTGSSFDSIRVTNIDHSFWWIDNIQLGSVVPEPANWAMLIAGFGLTGAVMRRRRALMPAA